MELMCSFVRNRVGNRPIFIWGAWESSKILLAEFDGAGLNVEGIIDGKKNGSFFYNRMIYNLEQVFQKFENPYIVLSIAEHASVVKELEKHAYEEYTDYLYAGKCVVVTQCNNYWDLCGNRIEGVVKDTQIKLGLGSILKIEKGVKIGKNVRFICEQFSKITLSENCIIEDGVVVEARDSSEVFIAKSVRIEKESSIMAKKKSKIYIGVNVNDNQVISDYIPNGFNTEIRHHATMICSNHSIVKIGRGVSFGHQLKCVVSHQTSFVCGDDCLFSYDVNVRGNNGHTIIDMDKKTIHGGKKSVIIEPHVWVGLGVTLLPGSVLKHNCVVGADTIINKEYPSGSIIAGNPAKVVRTHINWDYKAAITYDEFETRIQEEREGEELR